MFEAVNEFLRAYALTWILSILGETSFLGQLISNSPVLLFAIVLAPIVIIWAIAIFVDFVKDSWKMPFGVILDIFAIIFFATFPWALAILAIAAGIGYYFLANGGKGQNITYGVIAGLRFLIILPIVPLPETLKVVLVLIPICTMATFFLCITD